jgi:2-aminomuconate deaminase
MIVINKVVRTMNQSTTHSELAPEPVGLYPHAKRIGPLLFLSGIGPRVKGQENIPGVELNHLGEVVDYDIEQQCHQVFLNVKSVLQEAGARWEQLCDITVFLTNIKRDFKTFNKLYAEYFDTVQPCRTTVEVNALPTPIAIELKCIAYLGETDDTST